MLKQDQWTEIQKYVLEDHVRQAVHLAMVDKRSHSLLQAAAREIRRQDDIDRRWLLTDLHTVLNTMHKEESTSEERIFTDGGQARAWPFRHGGQSTSPTPVLDLKMRDFDKIRAFQEEHITQAVTQAQGYYNGITRTGVILCWLLQYQSQVERAIYWSGESWIPSRVRRDILEGEDGDTQLGTLIYSPLTPRLSAALTALECGWEDFGTYDSVYGFVTIVRMYNLSDMDWDPFWPRLLCRAKYTNFTPPMAGQLRPRDPRNQCLQCGWPRTLGIDMSDTLEHADHRNEGRLRMDCRCKKEGMLPPDWAEHGRYGTHRMLVQAFGGGYASYRPWGNEEHTSNMAQLGAGNAGIRDYVWEKGNKIANIARMVYDDYTAADSPSRKAVDTPHKKVIRVMQVQNWNYGFESCNYSEAQMDERWRAPSQDDRNSPPTAAWGCMWIEGACGMHGGYGETPPRGTRIDWELVLERVMMATFRPTKVEFHTCSQHELLIVYDETNHAWSQTYRLSDPRRWNQRQLYANREDWDALRHSCDQMTLDMLRERSIGDEDTQTRREGVRKCRNCFMEDTICKLRKEKQTETQRARRLACKGTKRCYACHSRQHRQSECPEVTQRHLCQKCGAGDHSAERCESRPCRWCGQYQRCWDTVRTQARIRVGMHARGMTEAGGECWTHQIPHDFSPQTGTGAQAAILDHIFRWESVTREETTRSWRERSWKALLAVHLHTMVHLRYDPLCNDLCRTWDEITNTPVQ